MAYEITEENRRRLELMKAFGTIEGKEVTFQHLVNIAIERLFLSVCENYSDENRRNKLLKEAIDDLSSIDAYGTPDQMRSRCYLHIAASFP